MLGHESCRYWGRREIQRHCSVGAPRDDGDLVQPSAEKLMARFQIEFEVEPVGVRLRHERKRKGKDNFKVFGLSTGRVVLPLPRRWEE